MLKTWRIAPTMVIVLLMTMILAACGGETPTNNTNTGNGENAANDICATGSISFDGSSALFPLLEALANQYQDECDGATINAAQSGSGTGLSKAQEGAVTIGNSDVFADPAEYPDLVDNQIAIIAFSVIVSDDVTGVEDLTQQQLIDIYTGKITNWKDVGGPDAQITTIVRKANSGTRLTFQQFVLNGGTEKEDAATLTADSSGDVASTLKSTPHSIAYVANSYAVNNNLKQIKIDGADATVDNIKNNTYKFWNIGHMYTKGEATGLAKSFIDYVKSDNDAVKKAFEDNGFITISVMEQSALDAKKPA